MESAFGTPEIAAKSLAAVTVTRISYQGPQEVQVLDAAEPADRAGKTAEGR